MSLVRDGIPAAPGIVIAPARVLRWEVPRVPHGATITPDQVTREIAAQLGLDEARGVLVRDVAEGSPAAEARLQPGDVIVGIDEARIDTVEDLFGELRQRRPGTEARLTIIRDGRSREVTVTLADRPD